MSEGGKWRTSDLAPDQRRQLRRFCAYGFLKNLQFFDPFLILVFREKGFSFAAIGLLVAFRSICINILEIPSGAIADTWGRRRSMLCSMLSYMLSFIIFAAAKDYAAHFPAMLLFAIGEAFRTGTHKAMIFDWLNRQGLKESKTTVYGLTRSWSKQGSSLNCLVAAAIVIGTHQYRWVFLAALAPYALNALNLFSYPRYLDGEVSAGRGLPQTLAVLREGLSVSLKKRSLRNLIAENVCFEGFFSVVKDYLQPTLQVAALGLPILVGKPEQTRVAVAIAAVYFFLNQMSSVASRRSGRIAARAGGERRLARMLWFVILSGYLVMGMGFWLDLEIAAILGFILLAVLLNVWKPAIISRFHDEAPLRSAATILSIANQSKTLSIAVFAPLVGLAVDCVISGGAAGDRVSLPALWPVAAVGAATVVIGWVLNTTATEK